jgi:hypothetical protein
MKPSRQSLAALALVLGLVSWGGVAYLANRIAYESEARVFAEASEEQSSIKHMSAIRTRALALETKDERAELERLLNADVIALANIIESAGERVGVTIRISDALPESVGTGAPLEAFGFVVEAQGSFSSLMHVSAALVSLPVPVSLEQLEFEHVASGGGNAGSWRLSARLRILTAAHTNV